MDVIWALVAYLQPPEAVHPRQSSLHDPSVSAQLLAGFDASSGDAWGYAPLPQSPAASREVVGLVRVQLHGPLARASTMGLADRRDGVYDFLQSLGVVDVGGRVDHRERDAASVDHNVALRARFAFIRRIRSALLAPRERPR